ncbi:MAG: hypothetical protein U5O39_19715 [Gammaproteobacteria bacterium]|nr:hypothetical protein [Gammaproteobacteria bacterium]
MSRFRAAFYHFLISLGIFAVIVWFILFRWFPDFFFAIDGGREGLRIIIGVGLVSGPLLTLVVFKAGKPGLGFDLLMIGTMQALCLAGGIYVVYSERPTFFIYYEKHFYSASADTYRQYRATSPDPDRFGGAPAMVYVDLPINPIEEADIRKIYYDDQIPLWTASDTTSHSVRKMDEVLQAGRSAESIRKRDTGDSLDRWLDRHEGSFEDYAFIPIHSRYRNAYLPVRRADKSFADLLEVKPPAIGLPPQPRQ